MYKSLEAIAAETIDDMHKNQNINVKLTSDYDSHLPKPDPKQPDKEPAQDSSIDEVRSAGQDLTLVILSGLGFKVGDVVTHKDSKTVRFTIKSRWVSFSGCLLICLMVDLCMYDRTNKSTYHHIRTYDD